MKRKVAILSLCLMLFVSSPVFAFSSADTPYGLLVGLVDGIAEKMGLNFDEDKAIKVADRILGIGEGGNEGAVSFLGRVAVMSGEKSLDNDETSYLTLDPKDFLDGAKLIEQASKDLSKTGEETMVYGQCFPGDIPSSPTSTVKTYIHYKLLNGIQKVRYIDKFMSFSSGTYGSQEAPYTIWDFRSLDGTKGYFWEYSSTNNGLSWSLTLTSTYTTVTTIVNQLNDGESLIKWGDINTRNNCPYTPVESDFIDTTVIPTVITNNYDNDVTNYGPITIVYNDDYSTSDLSTTNNTVIEETEFLPPEEPEEPTLPSVPDEEGGLTPVDTGVLSTIKNYTVAMYEGVTGFFITATDGFKDLTLGMVGFTTFLGSFFSWLPKEYMTLLGAGFSLGVVAFFLRR